MRRVSIPSRLRVRTKGGLKWRMPATTRCGSRHPVQYAQATECQPDGQRGGDPLPVWIAAGKAGGALVVARAIAPKRTASQAQPGCTSAVRTSQRSAPPCMGLHLFAPIRCGYGAASLLLWHACCAGATLLAARHGQRSVTVLSGIPGLW